MESLEPIRDYLRWWGAPEAVHLEGALVCAEYGPKEREKVADHFVEAAERLPVSPDVFQNRTLLDLMLGGSDDVVLRPLSLGANHLPALIAYVDHMVTKDRIITLLDTLLIRLREVTFPTEAHELERFLRQESVTASEAKPLKTMKELTGTIVTGNCLLLVEGLFIGLEMPAQGWDHRSPQEPTAEPVVRGPKEGFVETATLNLALVRSRLADPRLRVEAFTIGKRTNTRVYVVYLSGLALPEIVQEIRDRLKRIKIDSILESSYIKELIEDTPWTPFPLLRATERPDVIAGEILEGRVAIIVNGTPHALVAPHTFVSAMQAAEDYYERYLVSSAIRLIRWLFLFIALFGPSIYVAITTFHHEMVPTNLMLSIISNREGVPFPAILEALMLEVSFEALREAGIRLPKPVGQAVSIIGGLVIGDSAVRAGLVSPILVVVVAITGIASFLIPNFSTALSIRLLRFPMILLAATFGFYGMAVGVFAMAAHLASLRSFGVPYTAPIMPLNTHDLEDIFIRAPRWAMRKRPKFMPKLDSVREVEGERPSAAKQ